MNKGGGAVAIVGAGRVGQALGRLLAGRGYEIGEVVSRRAGAAREAVRFIGGGRALGASALGEVASPVVLVAVPDDAIAATAGRLASSGGDWSGRVALHTSGSRDGSELDALRGLGCAVGSMHPLQSFSSPERALASVAGSVFAIEGDRAAAAWARRAARALGGRPVAIRRGQKALYHAAAVLAAGHAAALLDLSWGAMRRAGLDAGQALDAILPLLRGTLANVEQVGTAEALTGPFARGDRGTIERNRAALAGYDELAARVYDDLGEQSVRMKGRGKKEGV